MIGQKGGVSKSDQEVVFMNLVIHMECILSPCTSRYGMHANVELGLLERKSAKITDQKRIHYPLVL